jgi:hypothetical protein
MLVMYTAFSRPRLAGSSAYTSRWPMTMFICTAKSSSTPVRPRPITL